MSTMCRLSFALSCPLCLHYEKPLEPIISNLGSLENALIIITGDAIALEGNHPIIANPQFTLDIQ